MPKLYKTVIVPTEASKEITVTGLISTVAEPKKIIACIPDDSLTTSYFVAYREQEKVCDYYIDNLAGEESKEIEIDLVLTVGQTFYVGYLNPAAVSGPKMVVIIYEKA